MTEREQVIANLLFMKKDFLEGSDNDRTIDRAVKLLKEQEARVMTLEELLALPQDTPVFIEENNGECGWNVFYEIDEENDVCFCGFRASADYYDVESYGEEYICWTYRPTEEQRKAVKWDD